MSCVYLGDDTGDLFNNEKPIHKCQLLEKCVLKLGLGRIASCDNCNEKLDMDDLEFADKWIDPLQLFDRTRNPAPSLRNLLAGRSVFLVCGGPSANDLPLEDLNRRGCWSFCVNNMAGHHRFKPQAFVCSDPPSKFSSSIWLDPGIMKFVPLPKMGLNRGRIREKRRGEFHQLNISPKDCPNTWGFQRRSWMKPDASFFLEEDAAWGNHDRGAEQTKEPKTVCTMLLAMRLLKFLGAFNVFMIGVDFGMDANKGPIGNYAFDQIRDVDACVSNNEHYTIVNKWLCKMQQDGVFRKFGISFFNCNLMSNLRAFPYVSFERALTIVTNNVEQQPDLAGWYEK